MKNIQRMTRPLVAVAMTLGDIVTAVIETRSFLLGPIVLVLVALALILVLLSLSGPLAPFVYPLL